jgi:hypothetical protein
MPFSFRPGKRESLSLLIGLAGGTGSGKTFSAMRLAAGLAGGREFAVVDTENGRANFYSDNFKFQHGHLSAPFRPDSYIEAIQTYDKAGFPVIVVDSASHEYAGEGGILDWHEELLDEFVERAIKGGDTRPDWQIAEAQKMRAWIQPKMSHKSMMARLLQVKAHVVLCFRAESKTEIGKETYKDGAGKEKTKTVIREKQGLMGRNGWFPICEKNMPFEMTTYLLMTAENPGLPIPITLREPHKPFFPLDKPITEESGAALAAWAHGGGPSITIAKIASASDVPAGAEPVCNPCSKDAGKEMFMVFVPSGQYEAHWRCPKNIKEHKGVKHADVLERLKAPA